MAGHLSTSTHPFNIQIHIAAYHGRSEAPKLAQTWIPHVAVATSLSPRLTEKEAWQLHRACKRGRTWWKGVEQDGMRAMDGLIGWICMMDGWIDRWMNR